MPCVPPGRVSFRFGFLRFGFSRAIEPFRFVLGLLSRTRYYLVWCLVRVYTKWSATYVLLILTIVLPGVFSHIAFFFWFLIVGSSSIVVSFFVFFCIFVYVLLLSGCVAIIRVFYGFRLTSRMVTMCSDGWRRRRDVWTGMVVVLCFILHVLEYTLVRTIQYTAQ